MPFEVIWACVQRICNSRPQYEALNCYKELGEGREPIKTWNEETKNWHVKTLSAKKMALNRDEQESRIHKTN